MIKKDLPEPGSWERGSRSRRLERPPGHAGRLVDQRADRQFFEDLPLRQLDMSKPSFTISGSRASISGVNSGTAVRPWRSRPSHWFARVGKLREHSGSRFMLCPIQSRCVPASRLFPPCSCLPRDRLVQVSRTSGASPPVPAKQDHQGEPLQEAVPNQLVAAVALLQSDKLKATYRHCGWQDGGRARFEEIKATVQVKATFSLR